MAAFESYEEGPRELADLAPLTDGATDWVPYVEGAETQTAGSTSGGTVVPSEVTAASARPSTQSLLKRARMLMSRRTAASRN